MVYGKAFSLEYYSKNNWEPINMGDINWTTIGYILFAGDTNEEQMNLYSLIETYNNGKKGRYRIMKDVGIFLLNDRYFLCAEFEIK